MGASSPSYSYFEDQLMPAAPTPLLESRLKIDGLLKHCLVLLFLIQSVSSC